MDLICPWRAIVPKDELKEANLFWAISLSLSNIEYSQMTLPYNIHPCSKNVQPFGLSTIWIMAI